MHSTITIRHKKKKPKAASHLALQGQVLTRRLLRSYSGCWHRM